MRTRSHALRYRPRLDHQQPLANINITPFIDVLLVLIVMLILSIPVALHNVKVDLPGTGTAADIEPVTHSLSLDRAGRTYWDSQPIARAALDAKLTDLAREEHHVLALNVEPQARYERFDQVIGQVKGAGVRSIGFSDHERFAAFGKAERPPR